ncbi:MAG: FAD-dependent oxidoreductase [Candidatus Aegiribacteria sp.]|nr:FAD-dependent oxidoreductase [Candidatus Aegiribacteria sp.]MBD3294211.1 FAD-dependent oxidoreductase [Candidatus Fermentibacteria bacterium]
MKVAVLGAGLAGLSAAEVLSRRDTEVIVLEKEERLGGLASTIIGDGFRFDPGPHRFHTLDPAILERVRQLLPDDLTTLERVSRIRLMDRYFRYPLALGDVLRKMPKLRGAGMLASYLKERILAVFAGKSDEDFESWVVSRFGRNLYDIYFGPYTAKLWGCPPSKLSADWASQRITVPSLTGLLRETIFPGKKKARSLVSTFHYPEGGIGRISEAMAERTRSCGGTILTGSEVTSVVQKKGEGFKVTAGGSDHHVDRIVSTIPLDIYVKNMDGGVPERVLKSAEKLTFRAIVFVTVRIRGERPPISDHWIYTPEERYRFNRISIPENFNSTPDVEGWQAVFEFTCRRGDKVWNAKDELVEETVSGGEALDIFSERDVVDSMVHRQTHAYPVYMKGYRQHTSTVLDFLEDLEGSVTCGRQGLFRYNNMDHSIEMGRWAALETLGEGSVRKHFSWSRSTWADG